MTRLKTCSLLLATLAVASAAEKLTPIFDGKTLHGWSQCNGTARYYVKKGELVGVTSVRAGGERAQYGFDLVVAVAGANLFALVLAPAQWSAVEPCVAARGQRRA